MWILATFWATFLTVPGKQANNLEKGEKRRLTNEGSGREGMERRRSPRLSVSKSSTSPVRNDTNYDKHSKKSKKNVGACSSNTNNARAPSQKDDAVQHHNDSSTNYEQPPSQSTQGQVDKGYQGQIDESWLPEKNILELVLDTLQRRDTYEIFAEPVDPSEVEEYYEIIKEPMDFGTMRAKLHEGMYKNLQQFEHDVFLIFDNAMHFNSSSTIYFRQARALEELAKKVFHVLRTDPNNFELEFASTRRRSTRGISYGESKASNFGSSRKFDGELQPNNVSPIIGRRGCKKERRNFMSGIDRRSSYKPWTLDEKCSTFSPIYHGEAPIINEKMSYTDSLMAFVKDLGPTAQRVAQSKLKQLAMATPNHTFDINKPVQALGFSRFLDTTASANKRFSSCMVRDEDQGNMNSVDINKPVQALGFSRFLNTTASSSKRFTSCMVRDEDQGNTNNGKFDLNQQVQSVSSDESSPIAENSRRDDHNVMNNNMASSMGLPMHGQFIFDLPYLKTRMKEMSDVDGMNYSYKMGRRSIPGWFG